MQMTTEYAFYITFKNDLSFKKVLEKVKIPCCYFRYFVPKNVTG